MSPNGYIRTLHVPGPIIIQPGTGWSPLTSELLKDEHDQPNQSLLGMPSELPDHWRSDQLTAVNFEGKSFQQTGGYWECVMKLPTGTSVRPAFWLSSANIWDNPRTTNACELTVFEADGVSIQAAKQQVTIWDKTGLTKSKLTNQRTQYTSGVQTYRSYSIQIEQDYCIFRIDNWIQWKVPSPPEVWQPFVCTVELGLSAGWDGDHMTNPGALLIEELNVHSKKPVP